MANLVFLPWSRPQPDYVKFAKFTPLQDENARYLDSAYDFVNTTHQRLEAEIAEEKRKAEEERKLQAEEKKPEDEIMEKKIIVN